MVRRMAFRPSRPWGPAAWLTMSGATRSSSAVSSPACRRRTISSATSFALRSLMMPAFIPARGGRTDQDAAWREHGTAHQQDALARTLANGEDKAKGRDHEGDDDDSRRRDDRP